MKRAGFTMIELIFVIVILGILSAVALPKFIGVSEQAQVGKVKAFVGTLNRTVAPALWSQSISENNNGAIGGGTYTTISQIETPESTGDTAADNLANPDLTACTVAAFANPDAPTDAELLAGGVVTTTKIGTIVYNLRCHDGSMTTAPRFVLEKVGTASPLVK